MYDPTLSSTTGTFCDTIERKTPAFSSYRRITAYGEAVFLSVSNGNVRSQFEYDICSSGRKHEARSRKIPDRLYVV